MAHSILHSTNIGSFYLKRLLRIWPSYLAATAFAFFVGKLIGAEDIQKNVVLVAFYLHAETTVTPQFWSLPYEVFFYLLCPFILATRKTVVSALFLAIALCIATVAAFGLVLNPAPNFFFNFFGNELAFLACGAVAYHYLDRIPKLKARPYWLLVTLLLAGAWLAKSLTNHINILSSAAMVCVAIISIRSFPDWLARTRWLNLGFFSYSIYLFNYAILLVAAWLCKLWLGIDPHTITNPIAWMAIVPLLLVGCYLGYLLTERPSSLALNRIRQLQRQGRPVALRT